MTKETKIGLLVGLTFIILFAVILSEKSNPRRAESPSFGDTDRLAEAGGSGVRDEPLQNEGQLPVEDRLGPVVAVDPNSRSSTVPMTEEPIGQPIPDGNDSIPPLPADVVVALNNGGETGPPAMKETLIVDPTTDANAAPGPGAPANDSAGGESGGISLDDAIANALNNGSPPPSPSGPAPSNRGSNAEGTNGGQAAGSGGSVAPERIDRPVLTVHRVEPGESLGKIAARYYGRATPERVEAIYQVNRTILPSVHSVRSGVELRIPKLEGTPAVDPRFESAPSFAGADPARRSSRGDEEIRIPIPVDQGTVVARRGDAQTADTRAPSRVAHRPGGAPSERSATVRWYVVQERDTLAKIAERELGSEGRYPEIYRLNKDTISNKNLIRPGMKIRLPVAASLSTGAMLTSSTGGVDQGV